jgi:uncharacterized Zn finger protein (UPF0148 family)
VKEHPCPECGSLLLERPKSYRCWNCGAELDKDLGVKKHGDPEAEAAARAAKAAARAERAKARSAKTAAKRTSAKRPAAKKRSTTKRSTAKRASAKRPAAASGNGDAPAASDG